MEETKRHILRGDIYLADLRPAVGSEQDGVRPVLIIQNNTGNLHSPTVIAAAITSRQTKSRLPTHVRIGKAPGMFRNSIILLEQIRTLDKSRLLEYIGSAKAKTMQRVDTALNISVSSANASGLWYVEAIHYMICISGDTHGDFRRFATKNFPQQKKMSREDCLIITGDFGGLWNGSKEQNAWLDWLEDKPFTTLFIDGNHENYTMLNALPITEWNGGKVHRVREHVLHLMRGQVFRLDDMTFFTMGGAASHDIEGGVLDPNAPDFQEQYFQAALSGKRFRILGESWWPEELPSDEEYVEAMANLERVGWQVNCILTHCAPTSIALQMSRHNEADRLTDFLETIKQRCEFDYWFFGHYHKDVVIEDKYFLQYGQMTVIE